MTRIDDDRCRIRANQYRSEPAVRGAALSHAGIPGDLGTPLPYGAAVPASPPHRERTHGGVVLVFTDVSYYIDPGCTRDDDGRSRPTSEAEDYDSLREIFRTERLRHHADAFTIVLGVVILTAAVVVLWVVL